MKKQIKKFVVASCLPIGMAGLTSPVSAERYYIPWLDNSVSGTGVALSNEDGTDKDVTIRVYDPTGTIVDVEDVTIPANGKRSFLVASGYTGQGSIEIDSPDGTLTNIALEGMRDEKVLLSVGTTEGFCHNLINHIAVSSQWDSYLKIANPTDVDVAYEAKFIGVDGEEITSLSETLAARASVNINLKTKLESILGAFEKIEGKVKVDSGNPLAAILTYDDFKIGNFNTASVKASPYESDYMIGDALMSVDNPTFPKKFYVIPGSSEAWIKFPSTFSIYDVDNFKLSLDSNTLDLSWLSSGQIANYTVNNHAGHSSHLIFIGDDESEIIYPANNRVYSSFVGTNISVPVNIVEQDMFQEISLVELYKSGSLLRTFNVVPSYLVFTNINAGITRYEIWAYSSVSGKNIAIAKNMFYIQGKPIGGIT